uniref:Chromodomain helicase DNA binding protein 6 n=1 Tax=Latimeria chalumnae TaxID=7897 RepID=H3ART7_LATCH
MKILKKEKQLPAAKVSNHTLMSDGPVGLEQKSLSSSSSKKEMESLHHQAKGSEFKSHCEGQKDPRPREQSTVMQKGKSSLNGSEDSGGGGTGVKKKRKKKELKNQDELEQGSRDKETKPKKKRDTKEPKEPKKVKEPKEAKKPRKPREPKERKEPREGKEKKNTAESSSKGKGKKAGKVPGPTPVEKKKKGKRKSENPPEDLETEDVELAPSSPNGAETPESSDGQKRRSGRQVKRRKYNEDLDFKVVDDDGETIAVLGTGRASALSASTLAWQAEEPPEDDANIIEKILAVRMTPKELVPGEAPVEIEEFYVKYRNFSYLHCKWATLEELEKDPRIHQKIKRFRTKQAHLKHIFSQLDEDLFNPDYVEVDRVLDVAHTKDTETGEEVTHYLVKWCSLPYEESTWELEEDVDPVKVKEFEDLQVLPQRGLVERPPSEAWQKLEKSRGYKNNNQLREYQLEGMNWLLFNWYNRKNCILADEMGLGKTIQSITFLSEIFQMGIQGPFLIIAPLSTITNWEREFRTWTEMNVIVYHGSQISRQMIQQYEMLYRDVQGSPIPGLFKFHVIITTFEMILADCPELRKISWNCVVIDEAHRLKNKNCKLLEGLKLMGLEHKVLLTGTPLQNSVDELFSLLNFLEPIQFPSETTFLEEFGDLKTEEQVKKLQAILKPMMLRRLKDDVEKNLAPKEETIIEVELTNIQKKYYRAILEKNFTFLAKGANQHNMPNLINTMMELRKCCNHPYLINGAEEKILEDFRKSHDPDTADFQLQAMIQAAGKLVLIDKLLPKLIAGGHKVLIFSQMVRCLDILEDYLIQRRYTYERIDGRVRGNLRQAAIDRFCKPDSDRFVFLLCTRAGGLGINLTAADTCIIFDSDWNPQNDLQAQARCHRIGQNKAVKVYRLITRNSYEREMFDKASLKLGLDKAVLQDINRKGNTNGVQQLSKMEVEDLLRKGAYGALMDEEDEGSKFCEEDIDQILQRRTQTITIQTEGKGSTFAKASFIASGNRTDISLDDPNFWQKWAKIAELEIDSNAEKDSLVLDRPRVRKQTRHYNSFEDDELMEFSELDSDTDERPSRSRRLNEKHRRYLRAECFRVEKNLLIFGWGRWKDILTHGRFKWHLNEKDMEMICRALLAYCVKHYKGDDKIKSFIWDLITPTKDGENQALQNHSGLSAPVPRGRKGKKVKNQMLLPEIKNADWLASCNPEIVLYDDSYKKHLKQHCNKVLLRVRMLYYLKSEVLGEAANKALDGTSASELHVALPDIDFLEVPSEWWNAAADKSLLIGVYKHAGYERYNAMRADPTLGFLERVGMPDEKSLSAEQSGTDAVADLTERNDVAKEDNTEEVFAELSLQDQPEDSSVSCVEPVAKREDITAAQVGVDPDRPCWPVASALTARLRRLITAYQRCNRKELIRTEFLVPGNNGFWYPQEEMFRRAAEMDPLMKELQKRWTRREQADFYRTVSSFGVIYDPEKKCFDWSQFRTFSRLERKTDESLEKYFYSFVAMCRNVCRLPPRKDECPADPAIFVEPITEERAARTLYRIELLRKVREQVLRHPQLTERLKLCRPSLYLPVWWECDKHDRDLLIGAAKHGLSRTDYYIMNDPQLSFLEAYRNYGQHENTRFQSVDTPCCLYQNDCKQCDSPGFNYMEVKVQSTGGDYTMEGQEKTVSSVDEAFGLEKESQDVTCEDLRVKMDSLISSSPTERSDSLSVLHDGKCSSAALLGSAQHSDAGLLSTQDALCCAQAIELAAEGIKVESDILSKAQSIRNLQTNWEESDEQNLDSHLLTDPQTKGTKQESQTDLHSGFDHTRADCNDIMASPAPVEVVGAVNINGGLALKCDCVSPEIMESSGSGLDSASGGTSKMILNHDCGGEIISTDVEKDLEAGIEGTGKGQPRSAIFNMSQNEAVTEEGLTTQTDPTKSELQRTINLESELHSSRDVKPMFINIPSENETTEGKEGSWTELDLKQNLKEKGTIMGLCELSNGLMMVGPHSEYLSIDLASDLKVEPGESSEENSNLYSEPETCGLKEQGVKLETELSLCEEEEEEEEEDGEGTIQSVLVKSFEEGSKPSITAPLDEAQEDFLQDARAPTIAQLLQEKTLYSFSEWPKDRVIINRIDNICHVVLKGKWPSSCQQFDTSGLESARGSVGNTNIRNCFSSGPAQEALSPNANKGAVASSIQKECLMPTAFQRDPRRRRRPYELETESDTKHRSLEELAASHARSPVILNGWQDAAVDLSRSSEMTLGPPTFHVGTNAQKLGSVRTLPNSLGMDLSGILQAGLIHPVTGQIVNGNLRREDSAVRRRRGRRRNIEGIESLFIKNQTLQDQVQSGTEVPKQPLQSSVQADRQSSATPVQFPENASSLQLEKEVANRSLLDWLRQHPDFTMNAPPFSSSFSDRPKQRRQRCKDPSKLDINTLTGEERVPVVHRGTGRRGFLPENKFNCILTEPVPRDTGPRRRGRRPRSEMVKAAGLVADHSSTMAPLFMNGLIAGMDLVGLQNIRNMQNITLTGLVGFPASFTAVSTSEEVKNSLLPMMLPGMSTVPHVFGVGGLLNPSLSTTTTCTSTASSTLTSTTKSSPLNPPKAQENLSSNDINKDDSVKDKQGPGSFSEPSEPAVTTSSPVAFNPFLIPGVSPGLLYPSMFLSPDIRMACLQQARHSEMPNPESPKRKKKKAKEVPDAVAPPENSAQEKEENGDHESNGEEMAASLIKVEPYEQANEPDLKESVLSAD